MQPDDHNSSTGRASAPPKLIRAVPAVAAVLGVLLSLGTFGYLRSSQNEIVRAEFNRRAADRAMAIEQELNQIITRLQLEGHGPLAWHPNQPDLKARRQLLELVHQIPFSGAAMVTEATQARLWLDHRMTPVLPSALQQDGPVPFYCGPRNSLPRVTVRPNGIVTMPLLGHSPGNQLITGFEIDEQAAWAIQVPIETRDADEGTVAPSNFLVIAGTFESLVNRAFSRLQAGGVHVALATASSEQTDRPWEYVHTSRTEIKSPPDIMQALATGPVREWYPKTLSNHLRIACFPSQQLTANVTTSAPQLTLLALLGVTGILYLYLRKRLNGVEKTALTVSQHIQHRVNSHRMHGAESDRRSEPSRNHVTAKGATDSALKIERQYLSKMNHELRTPLNGVIGSASLLGESPGLDSNQKEYVGIIQNSAQQLLEVIDSILKVSQIHSGNLSVENRDVDLIELLEGLLDEFSSRAAQKDLTLTLTLDHRIPDRILSDQRHLEEILRRLLANAVNFTPSGHIEVRAEVTGALEGRSNLAIAVIDTGVGIDLDQQSVIFEPFSQADNSSSRLFSGAGLGLTISNQLAQLLGGTITVVSSPQQGCTFTLELTVDHAHQTPYVGRIVAPEFKAV